jgi:hypothetical protein
MPAVRIPIGGHPLCPECRIGMIAVSGPQLDPERQTFECLRCGRIQKPETPEHSKAPK